MKKQNKFIFPKDTFIELGGYGLWSEPPMEKKVKLKHMTWEIWEDFEERFYTLYSADVYFYKSTWNTAKEGLIYTNEGFRKNIRKLLNDFETNKMIPKFGWKTIDYTEQGMQGDDYVSMEFNKQISISKKNFKKVTEIFGESFHSIRM